jgi:diguanylate cyclase (GGDEF)-like protein
VSLQNAMDRALAAALRSARPMAVLCLDLDRFKDVNDTLGHPAGDTLLRHVAARLRGCARGGGFAARVGGDEFVLLQQDAEQPEGAHALAQRIIERLGAPFSIDGHTVTIGSSVGIALSSPQDNDSESLLRQADIALYHAKDSGRGQGRMFEPRMDRDLRDRRELEADLREAIADGSLVLHFQPLHACNGGALLGFEALARWTHPTRGPISPAQFIPIAEASGLIVPLGAWVLRAACAAAASWAQPYRISVNLSPAQFRGGDALAGTVAAVLHETGLLPSRLDLEVTEGVLLEGTEEALELLGGLRGLGAKIVLDDFGTGYSSLSYLHRFPFDKLKIDQSFVRKLESDPGARAIISAILVMSHKLGLRVTAEGVETEGQRKFLQGEGCDELQGYLFGRPMPIAEVETLLLKQTPRNIARFAAVAEA